MVRFFQVPFVFVFSALFAGACGQTNQSKQMSMNMSDDTNNNQSEETITERPVTPGQTDTATFGAGCFWCVEAVFQRLEGVKTVKSGYAGGFVKNPSYKEVCNGTTGHAEVCQITYDPSKVTYDELLEVFWKTHDPTTMNRQGNDVGTQYRSVVFYHNEEQKQKAEKYKKEINEAKAYPDPVITEIKPISNYYAAEDYHQNYYNQNGSQGYCQYVIQPKVEKFEKIFKNKLKKSN